MGSTVPLLQLKAVDDDIYYTRSQLLELRPKVRFARLLPRGSSERNGRRQIAPWLDTHTVEASQ
jgi:hypothetical protein